MKTYDDPKVGDVVYHIDEPFRECPGEVILIKETEGQVGEFQVHWYDGEAEWYEINDHPDIVQLEN